MRFAADGFWRGEVHRPVDRAAALARLLEEAAAAGVEQVLLVSAAPEPPAPHELRAARGRRAAAGWASGWPARRRRRCATPCASRTHRFHAVFVIRPDAQPGAGRSISPAPYDERLGSPCRSTSCMERGYEDAYRQFIEPVLGAAGDKVAEAGWAR